MALKASITVIAGLLALSACGSGPKVILEGPREMVGAAATLAETPVPLRVAAASRNSQWTHVNGTPNHALAHPSLGPSLAPVFSVSVGEPETARARVTGDPVVAGGLIYTVDAFARVTATDTAGNARWSRSLVPSRHTTRDGSGGAAAVSGNMLVVTTGYGEVVALDRTTGGTIWTQRVDAPATAAPTLTSDTAYVTTRDGRAWALDLENGRQRWIKIGTEALTSFGGGASPAVSGDVVVLPVDSGELIATFPRGLERWRGMVASNRVGRATAIISDVTADPVISGNTLYTSSIGGRTVALDLETGARKWTAQDGASGAIWLAGNALFMVNDVNELLRLDADTGAVIWRQALPRFTNPDRPTRRQALVAHYGPIFAGGRVIVASSDGVLRGFNPEDGSQIESVALPAGAASAPVVADETLYVVTKDGLLSAFR